MNKTKKGFTLIELIVVLAILAVIMAIAVPTAFGSIDSARKAADLGSLDGFNSTIRMQSSFVITDPTGTVKLKNLAGTEELFSLNTITAALGTSGISKTNKPQSKIRVKWVAPTENQCGYFAEQDKNVTGEYLTGGVDLNPANPLYAQLITTAGGEKVAIVQ